jgi:hypothetical protein
VCAKTGRALGAVHRSLRVRDEHERVCAAAAGSASAQRARAPKEGSLVDLPRAHSLAGSSGPSCGAARDRWARRARPASSTAASATRTASSCRPPSAGTCTGEHTRREERRNQRCSRGRHATAGGSLDGRAATNPTLGRRSQGRSREGGAQEDATPRLKRVNSGLQFTTSSATGSTSATRGDGVAMTRASGGQRE